MNSQEISQAMTRISGAYGAYNVTDEMALMWAEAFAIADGNSVLRALNDWVQSEQRPPTIAGIRQKMREVSRGQVREAQMYTSRLEPGETYLSIEEGKAVAAIAYERDCQEQGKEPNWTYFNIAMGLTGKAKKAGTR